MKKISSQERVYFPNLNGLRAIGACIVMIGHIDFIKMLWGIQVNQWFPIPGKIGVGLFFSLSGFLITSLLFNELEITHTIRLKDFYIRRILRIWPLYYMIVLLGIFVLNRIPALKIPLLSDRMYQTMDFLKILNIALIIPNFTHFYIPYSDQRWSIIVEEQFYLIQPAILRIFRKRKTLLIVLCVLVFSSEILRLLALGLHLDKHISTNFLDPTYEQLKYLGCIAVGCVFSVLYYKRESLTRNFLYRKYTQILVLLILIACTLISFYVVHNEEYFDYRIYCFLFSIVVVNAAQNPKTIYRLEHPVLNFLGKISYGIYMYHMACIGIAYYFARSFFPTGVVQEIVLFILSVTLTIFVSWISFTYFESFFLKLKPGLQSLVNRATRQKGSGQQQAAS